MNEMYNMSIVAHNYGVISILVVIFINFLMLFGINNLVKYMRAVSLFTPLGATTIGVVVFTGVVMMAAKHLQFSVANIAMITFAAVLIFLEVKRSSGLKYLDKNKSDAFAQYRVYAAKILVLEVVVTLLISAWMWI